MASPSQKLMFTLMGVVAVVGLLQVQVAGSTVNLSILNGLESREVLQVHCKDKKNDYGVHQIQPDQTYELAIHPGFRADYFCGFVFQNVLHWFDIYVGTRDWNSCGKSGFCKWYVKEGGPCGGVPGLNPGPCYPWNKD